MVFCYHGNKSTILLFYSIFKTTPEVSSNFTWLKYVKSQRSYGFLITKDLTFGFQILDLKDHFSASLKRVSCINWKFKLSMKSMMSSGDIYFTFYGNDKFYYKSLNTEVLVLGLMVQEYKFATSR